MPVDPLAILVAKDELLSLKYAYLRFLDLKRWDELGALLMPDVTTRYGDGRYSFTGRDAVLEFLSRSLGGAHVVSLHQVHHPEVRVAEDLQSAEATFYLRDVVIHTDSKHVPGGFELEGSAFYEDRFVRTDAGFRFAHLGYERVYESTRRRADGSLLRFTSRFEPIAG